MSLVVQRAVFSGRFRAMQNVVGLAIFAYAAESTSLDELMGRCSLGTRGGRWKAVLALTSARKRSARGDARRAGAAICFVFAVTLCCGYLS
jgi:hypothetical protein